VESSMTAAPDRPLYRASMILSFLGLLVAGYLTYIKYFPTSPLCTGVGDCASVNTSIYSAVMGVPVALLGAAAYASILAALLLETRLKTVREWGPLFVLGVAFAGVLYSAYLTYIEIAVIRAICPYCVASAVIITVIFGLAGVRATRKYMYN
jgi:uncharacterized membrane protein